jgi:hypothetical protein
MYWTSISGSVSPSLKNSLALGGARPEKAFLTPELAFFVAKATACPLKLRRPSKNY